MGESGQFSCSHTPCGWLLNWRGCCCGASSSYSVTVANNPVCFSGDSRGSARRATQHRGPSVSFTTAAIARALTAWNTVVSAPTLAAALLSKPPPLRWPSAASRAAWLREQWCWSTRVPVTTTALTLRSETRPFGLIGPEPRSHRWLLWKLYGARSLRQQSPLQVTLFCIYCINLDWYDIILFTREQTSPCTQS